MLNSPFIKIQKQFAENIRNVATIHRIDNVSEDRMSVYRELIYNNISSFLETSFPVLRSILSDTQWFGIVQDFIRFHKSTTPYYSEFPEEFLLYLKQERGDKPTDPPFLLELACYEWVELALTISEEEEAGNSVQESPNDILNKMYKLSKLAWPLAFNFPVHLISKDFQPDKPPSEPTLLVVFRDFEYQIRFFEVSHATFRFLVALNEQTSFVAKSFFLELAGDLGINARDSYLDYVVSLVEDLIDKRIIYENSVTH